MAEQQLVEIAKAFLPILILALDEPTFLLIEIEDQNYSRT